MQTHRDVPLQHLASSSTRQVSSQLLEDYFLFHLPVELIHEVLRHVSWSSRAVCRSLCSDVEARRTSLRISSDRISLDISHKLSAMLARLPLLRSLECCIWEPKLLGVVALPNLTSLTLKWSVSLRDLTPLAACTSLTSLNMSRCYNISDLRPLAHLVQLRSLDLSYCRALFTVRSLASCRSLTALDLDGCLALHDLRPLLDCVQLDTVKYCGTSFNINQHFWWCMPRT